jgi:cytochrome b subunit of formate dehydrogenase
MATKKTLGRLWVGAARKRLSRGWIALPVLLLLLPARPAHALTNDECLECHRDQTLTKQGPDGKETSLYVGAAAFGVSVHRDLACTDCHAGISELPHGENLARVNCADCHSDEQTQYAGSIHGQAAATGNPDAPSCADCHGRHDILPAADAASKVSKINLVGTCARCHADPAVARRLPVGDQGPVAAYLKSVHGKALLEKGNTNAPTCGTCHPAHNVLPPTDPNSSVNKKNLPATCAHCHNDMYRIYAESVHGVAVAAGNPDSPSCVDCHGEHQIESPENPTSSVFPANIAKTTCIRCHSSLVLARRYGFGDSRLASYLQTYHGLASRKGDLSVANCASCHGVHNIFRSSDPRSTVNVANLTKTCGSCHPDANARFASINVHPRISEGAAIQRLPAESVRWIYVLLLVVVIGGMAAHNGLIWWYHMLEKIRRDRAKPRIRRFTRLEALEHKANLIAFFILVFTGFALKYPDASWVRLTEKIGLTESLRGLIHRIMAVMMILVAISHTCFLAFTRRGRRDLIALMPKIRDVQDFLHNMAYHLRLRSDRPVFARFDYTEKAEYLALLWGTSVMVLTGLILWFPTLAAKHLPSWAYSVAEVIHFYEAWLAFLAILVWHFFYVFIHPESYPMNTTWLNGDTTVEHALHKHGKTEED